MKDFSKKNIDKINKLLSGKKNIVIIGHNNPDGDAIGGSLGMYEILKKAKQNVSVIMPSNPPEYLNWLPNYNEIVIFNENKEQTTKLINNAEIIFCIDFNSAHRVEKAKEVLKNAQATKILIDHHPSPDTNAEFVFSDTSVSSASELVFEFIENTKLSTFINKEMATCIFTGIMTDTLNFSVNSSHKQTFDIAGKLLELGIDKTYIYDKVYNNYSLDRLKIVGYLIYEKMQIIDKQHIAYFIFSNKDKKKFNFKDGDLEGIVNMPLSVGNIDASIMITEGDSFIKLSLRSKGDIDVNKLARKYFNGGGHTNAAGGRIYKPLNEVEQYIKNCINEYFN